MRHNLLGCMFSNVKTLGTLSVYIYIIPACLPIHVCVRDHVTTKIYLLHYGVQQH